MLEPIKVGLQRGLLLLGAAGVVCLDEVADGQCGRVDELAELAGERLVRGDGRVARPGLPVGQAVTVGVGVGTGWVLLEVVVDPDLAGVLGPRSLQDRARVRPGPVRVVVGVAANLAVAVPEEVIVHQAARAGRVLKRAFGHVGREVVLVGQAEEVVAQLVGHCIHDFLDRHGVEVEVVQPDLTWLTVGRPLCRPARSLEVAGQRDNHVGLLDGVDVVERADLGPAVGDVFKDLADGNVQCTDLSVLRLGRLLDLA